MSVVLAVLLAASAGWCLPAGNIRRLRLAAAVPHIDGPGRPGVETSGLDKRVLAWVLVHASWQLPKRTRRKRDAVVELCHAVTAELQSGAIAREALAAAAESIEGFEVLATTSWSTYGDIPDALRRLAHTPGYEALGRLAVCWQVCESSGAGLAVAVGRLAETLRDDEQVRRETAAHLAGPKATAVLLALLPIFGLAIGASLGAQPVQFLLHTSLGRVLVLTALALEVLGVVWTARITRQALPP